MAQKRMFDRRVVSSDKFTELPHSSKALYFMAGMEADDKGFFQPKRLQKACGFSDDDFKVLIAKRFFITFDSGVMVITDWNKNNYLDKNRITETEYVDELKLLKLINEKYEFEKNKSTLNIRLTSVKHPFNQYSIEENSIIYNNNNNNNGNSNEKDLFEIIQKEFGRTLSPMEYELIKSWKYSREIILKAIKEASIKGQFVLKYIDRILYNWNRAGLNTLEKIEQYQENFKRRKQQKEYQEEQEGKLDIYPKL